MSRMSRNAEEGIKTYFELFDRGVELVFLKEAYINTATYADNLKDKIELTGTDEDEIFKGLNNYFQRTKEGLETARLNGKQIGAVKGKTLTTKKSIEAKEGIRKYSKDFDGTLADAEVITLTGISRNSYYKYKKELKAEQ